MIARSRASLWRIASFLVLFLVIVSCKGASSGKTRIAVIPKGTTHEFWKSVHAGAVKASEELGVDITWKGPLREDDLKAQRRDRQESLEKSEIMGHVILLQTSIGLNL